MAGSSGALIRRGGERRPAVLIAGLVWTFSGALGAAERTADVLAVERPASLVIFNRYQQRLSRDEERRLEPYVPMIVLREHDHLGDGFTPCAVVEIGGEEYFLLRDEGGGLAARGEAGRTLTYRNVVILGDTVELLRGRALSLEPAGGGKEMRLGTGTRVLRVFEQGGKAYVRVPSGSVSYGWLALAGTARTTEWRDVERPATAGVTAGDLLQRLRPVVDRANSSLRQIYASLSAGEGKRSAPPSFRLSLTQGEIRCLLEPAPLAPSFSGSMKVLVAEFERVLGGTGRHVTLARGEILIPLH